MRILICNDDGIDAPGLAILEAVANRLSDDVWTVAPDGKRTAGSGSITVGRPLVMEQRTERRFSCSGTPADCVVTAMTWLFSDAAKPDLVLSGLNDGRNVAEDLIYSGTLGIAREATFWGVPAIGFSRVKNADVNEADVLWLADLVSRIWQARADWFPEGHYLSVNLPTRLPAAIAEPAFGRDKIGGRSEVTAVEGSRTTLLVPRGRPGDEAAGKENALIDAGYCTVNRLNWFGNLPIGHDRLEGVAPSGVADVSA